MVAASPRVLPFTRPKRLRGGCWATGSKVRHRTGVHGGLPRSTRSTTLDFNPAIFARCMVRKGLMRRARAFETASSAFRSAHAPNCGRGERLAPAAMTRAACPIQNSALPGHRRSSFRNTTSIRTNRVPDAQREPAAQDEIGVAVVRIGEEADAAIADRYALSIGREAEGARLVSLPLRTRSPAMPHTHPR